MANITHGNVLSSAIVGVFTVAAGARSLPEQRNHAVWIRRWAPQYRLLPLQQLHSRLLRLQPSCAR
jgi:hypothetical protein